MAWSNSKTYARMWVDGMGNTTAFDLDADTPKVALFDNSITPDNTVTAANSAYAAGVWASGGVSDASGWPAAGRALVSATWTLSSATATYDAADTSSANATTTLSGTYGCLVYDDTLTTPVADQGMSYNYFGGTQSVTSGTFTIVWNASGIFTLAA
jgi:hypothetical protein